MSPIRNGRSGDPCVAFGKPLASAHLFCAPRLAISDLCSFVSFWRLLPNAGKTRQRLQGVAGGFSDQFSAISVALKRGFYRVGDDLAIILHTPRSGAI